MLLKCPYCGHIGPLKDFELDHPIPVSRLTAYIPGNLRWICSGCNRQKGDKTPYEYMLWRILNPNQANYGPIR